MKAVKRPSGVIIVGEKTIPFVFEKSKLKKVVIKPPFLTHKERKKTLQKFLKRKLRKLGKMDLENKLYL